MRRTWPPARIDQVLYPYRRGRGSAGRSWSAAGGVRDRAYPYTPLCAGFGCGAGQRHGATNNAPPRPAPLRAAPRRTQRGLDRDMRYKGQGITLNRCRYRPPVSMQPRRNCSSVVRRRVRRVFGITIPGIGSRNHGWALRWAATEALPPCAHAGLKRPGQAGGQREFV